MRDELAFELKKIRNEVGKDAYQQECRDVMKFHMLALIDTYVEMTGVSKREACFVAYHEMIETIKQVMKEGEDNALLGM